MERVRRVKTCAHLSKKKRKIRLNSTKETDVVHQKEKMVTCSNDPNVCHPYEDRINLLHAMTDVHRAAKDLLCYIGAQPGIIYGPTVSPGCNLLNRRFKDSSMILMTLIHEVHFADKNRAWCKQVERWPTRFSQLAGNQNRKVPVCGNYVDHAEVMVQRAKRFIAGTENEREKRVHLKKLEFFEAMRKVQDIRKKYFIRDD